MSVREGVFMIKWIGAAAVLSAAWPAFAADVAICTLSTDRKTVTITASNPYSQVMACEVNCDMALSGGIATVVCVKPVPVGAKDFVMYPSGCRGPFLHAGEGCRGELPGSGSATGCQQSRPCEG